MKTLNIKEEYYEKIKELYDKFCDKYKDNKELWEILGRGLIIVKELFYEPDLLILGLNPSYNCSHNKIVEKQHNLSFWYPYIIPNEKGCKKRDLPKYKEIYIDNYIYQNFYKKYIEKINSLRWEYFDLFWVRVGGNDDKKYEFSDLKNTKLKEFLEEQIQISIEIIKKIHPKIIVGAFTSLGDDILLSYVKNDKDNKFLIINEKKDLENNLGNNSIIYVLKFLTNLPNPNMYDRLHKIDDYINLTNKLLEKLKKGDDSDYGGFYSKILQGFKEIFSCKYGSNYSDYVVYSFKFEEYI